MGIEDMAPGALFGPVADNQGIAGPWGFREHRAEHRNLAAAFVIELGIARAAGAIDAGGEVHDPKGLKRRRCRG